LDFRYAELIALAMDILKLRPSEPQEGRTRGYSTHNLPHELSIFVGREEEELCRLLRTSRLLTLTPTGGVGKTRLAIRLAHEVMHDSPDGVWFVELGPLSDPTLVARTIAATLAIWESKARPIVATLAARLARQRILLVLENCEHLARGMRRVRRNLAP
jgi:predicted ATPase